MLTNFLIIVLSIVLYCFAPNSYSLSYIIILFGLFLVEVIDLLKPDFYKKKYLTFNSLFLFSFFLTTFAFPLFVMSSDNTYNAFAAISMAVFNDVDFSCITKAVSLSLVAISFYIVGVKYATRHKTSFNYFVSSRVLMHTSRFIFALMSFMFVLSLYNVFRNVGSDDLSTDFSSNTYIFEIFNILVCYYIIVRTKEKKAFGSGIKCFFKYNYIPLIQVGILIIVFLNYGDRGPAISLTLLIVGTIVSMYKIIPLKYVLFLLLVGVISLFAIRTVRKIDRLSNLSVKDVVEVTSAQLGGNILILPFADLIGISQELCVGYTIKQKEGLQNSELALIIPFYVIPGAPSYVSKHFFGKEFNEINGSRLLNSYMTKNSTFGNHCVIDIFVKWGLCVLCVVFLMFGYVIGAVERNMYSSIVLMCIYLILFSKSIYLPRSSILDIIRPISEIWILLFIYRTIKRMTIRTKNR